MKTILVTIQIDEVKAVDLAELEEKLNEVLVEYPRKRVNYSLSDTLGQPLPIQQ